MNGTRKDRMCRVGIVWLLATSLFAASGCDWVDSAILGKKIKPGYCSAHPDDSDCPPIDAAVDAPDADLTCKSNNDCPDPMAGVCDLSGSKACVQCLPPSQTSACMGVTPVCVGTTCQRCTQHAECAASNACLPDGTCADAQQVAYVDPLIGSDNPTCAKATPCAKLARGIAAGKPYVKLHGTADEAVMIDISGKVTLLGDPGAKLTRTSNGLLLEIRGSSQVAIYDLEITGASGTNSPGISMPSGNTAILDLTRTSITNNAGGGISATGGTLTVSQSILSDNSGGGISISGATFSITNSIVVGNGGGATAFGGIRIDGITVAGTHVLDFNTIAANVGPATVNTGVACGTVLVPLTFSNNIIYANIVSGGGVQVGGSPNCSTTYSDIGPDTVSGANNINVDPMFVSASQRNFHLMASSQAKDAADPAATLTLDIDGDTRPQGVRRDMGADEIKQ